MQSFHSESMGMNGGRRSSSITIQRSNLTRIHLQLLFRGMSTAILSTGHQTRATNPPPSPLPETHPSKPTNQPTHQKNRRQRRLRVIQTLSHTKISLNLSKRLTKSKHPKLKVRELKRSGGKKILIRVKNKTDRLGLIFFRLHPTDLLLKLSLYGNNSH